MTESVLEIRSKWGSLVGRFILSFGDIENTTYLCLVHLPSERIFESLVNLHFAQRVEIIISLVNNKESISEITRASLVENLRKAKGLSKNRNIIAHSPLTMEIYEHQHTGEIDFQEVLKSLKNQNKSITFRELNKYVCEIEALAQDLNNAYNEMLVDLD